LSFLQKILLRAKRISGGETNIPETAFVSFLNDIVFANHIERTLPHSFSVARSTLLYIIPQAAIPAKAGIQFRNIGFRVKPGTPCGAGQARNDK
jgi:hypothetical protein